MFLSAFRNALVLGALLLAPAALGALSLTDQPVPPDLFPAQVDGPHVFVLQVNYAGTLTPQMLAQIRDFYLTWTAPTGWRLARENQPASAVLQVDLRIPNSGPALPLTHAMVWSNYAWREKGQTALATRRKRPVYFLTPLPCYDFPFEPMDLAYDDYYSYGDSPLFPPVEQPYPPYRSRPPHHHHHLTAKLADAYAQHAPSGGVRLARPSPRVIARAVAGWRAAAVQRLGNGEWRVDPVREHYFLGSPGPHGQELTGFEKRAWTDPSSGVGHSSGGGRSIGHWWSGIVNAYRGGGHSEGHSYSWSGGSGGGHWSGGGGGHSWGGGGGGHSWSGSGGGHSWSGGGGGGGGGGHASSGGGSSSSTSTSK